MTSQNSKKDDEDQGLLAGKSIYIIGRCLFMNELIAFYLERKTGANCIVLEDPSNISLKDNGIMDYKKVILLECPNRDPDEFLSRIDKDYKRYMATHLIALFNVNQDFGIEERVIASGVKGIFYDQDPLDRFQKGVGAIFEKELWVSREVLTKYVMENRKRNRPSSNEETGLTSRETEILAMISAGAKNEDIAEKLYISPNTVKTHIYNIFKKIDVPNRLQAALWAAKNL